jgi:nucleotide-binding universal stress UspA family protein
LDGSAFSRHIVPQLERLLDPNTYRLILLRVAEPVIGLIGAPPRPVSTGWTKALYENKHDLEYAYHPIYATQAEASERDSIEQALRLEGRDLKEAGYTISAEVRFGEAAEEIVACAGEHKVDLIAMATHGRTGLKRFALGSVAEEVVQRVSIPVLLIKPFEGKE